LAQGPDNYILAKSLPVECGVNRVLIRSTTQAGAITITAKAEGLKDGSITLQTKPVDVVNGLALAMPSDGLKPSLKRGPTPKGSSFVPSRKALIIVGATAGANAGKTAGSYDDNELSEWVNDGQLNTAWIKYTLAHADVVNEVTLKLNNFRSRRYPIKITVDNQEVFNGLTGTSLGYFTAKCKPAKGKTVTIQLMPENGFKEDNGIGVEVNGKKLDDGVARNDVDAKGTLSIIEAEIYKKLN
jgi:hypothetical protein